MTLKVLIVDDEPIIVQGLRETVPWEELGARVIGEAYDGEEAIEILQNTEVDLILSDVKMPIMDGLSLREWVHRHVSHIPTIMISGYEEFEYAQRALRLGVKDYLLKPVDIDELMILVQKISAEKIRAQKKECQQTMHQLLSATVMENEVAADMGNHLAENGLLLLGSEISHYANKVENMDDTEEQQVKQGLKDRLEEDLEKKGLVCASIFSDRNRLITLCVFLESKEDRKVWEIRDLMDSFADGTCSICIAPIAQKVGELKNSYRKLLKGMEGFPFYPQSVFYAEEIESDTVAGKLVQEEEIMQVFHAKEKTAVSADQLFTRFAQNKWPLARVCGVIKSVEERLAEDFSEELPFMFLKEVNLTVYNSYPILMELFLQDVELYFSMQESAMSGGRRWLIKKALSYIGEHYAEDLKAAEVARAIHVSPNHFSQLIKQETGKHFNDYLHEIRLNQAKRLLKESTRRIFEIAELVGYREYKYFVHIFKKSTSLTPTQYRNIAHAKPTVNG